MPQMCFKILFQIAAYYQCLTGALDFVRNVIGPNPRAVCITRKKIAQWDVRADPDFVSYMRKKEQAKRCF